MLAFTKISNILHQLLSPILAIFWRGYKSLYTSRWVRPWCQCTALSACKLVRPILSYTEFDIRQFVYTVRYGAIWTANRAAASG